MEDDEEEYEELDVPNYDINIRLLTANEVPLEWEDVLLDMINKSDTGKVVIPVYFHTSLLKHMDYISGQFVHSN